jgi:transcriptional regulator with XRE-family HTH domain
VKTPAERQVAEFQGLGRHLFTARTRLGLTQQQLGRQCGIDPATINRIERSQRWPTLAQLVRLARVLQISLQWFLNGSHGPGTDLADMAIELQHLGIVDLWVPEARVPGAFRPREELVALAVAGNEPEPRIVEALPAVLAWNTWDLRLVRAYARRHDARALNRLAWLADVALTIDKHHGFPGGCPARQTLSHLVSRVQPPQAGNGRKPAPDLDGLGRPASDVPVHPVWKRWRISYAADLETFRNRAGRLKALLDQHRPS